MHELSIAQSLIELASEAARAAGATRVTRVRVEVGALSGVVPNALRFCYDVAVRNTMLENAQMEIAEIPVQVWCDACQREQVLGSIQKFTCPACGAPCPRVTRGREIDVVSIEIECDEDINAAN